MGKSMENKDMNKGTDNTSPAKNDDESVKSVPVEHSYEESVKKQEKAGKRKKRVRKFFKIVGRTFTVLLALSLTLASIGAWYFTISVSNADTPDKPNELKDKSAVTILAADGSELAKVYPPGGTRKIVSPDSIPQSMKDALVSAEDSSFYKNPGFDPLRIAAAGFGHLSGNSSAGGASTLTQQFVKNELVGDDYSLERKWKEVLSATKLTAEWDKDDIISGYLNIVYFGRGATGVEKAAQSYFGIRAAELNKSQSAFLAGVIQSPSVHDPAINEESAKQRFNYVVGQMRDNGYLSPEEKLEFPETIPPKPTDTSTGIEGPNGHIVTMVEKELNSHGMSMEQMFTMGARINTTIDPRVQDSVVRNSQSASRSNGIRVSSVATDPSTGSIRGIYGGDDGQGFNYATEPQMTGSTFKVFTLAAGLENGHGLGTQLSSAPYFADGLELGNSGGATCGVCSLGEATKQSLNTSFYRLQDMLPQGPKTTREMAQRLGVEESLEDEGGFVAKSITLGSYGTSMKSMSHAMATIANNGYYNDQHIIDNIITRNDNTVYKVDTHGRQVLASSITNDIDRALEPIPAYSNGNQLSGKTGYGKTGTVQLGDTGQNRDAIMIGYTDNMALSVWTGTDDGSPLVDANGAMIWGAGVPATTWKNILNEVG